MPRECFLGFDFGLGCIGVAAGQRITKTAEPVTIVRAIDGEPNWDEINRIVDKWQPMALVVGVPYNMDDSVSPRTALAESFGRKLKAKTQLPVHFVDERLTTKEAKMLASKLPKKKRQGRLDSLAAKLILETWLRDQ